MSQAPILAFLSQAWDWQEVPSRIFYFPVPSLGLARGPKLKFLHSRPMLGTDKRSQVPTFSFPSQAWALLYVPISWAVPRFRCYPKHIPRWSQDCFATWVVPNQKFAKKSQVWLAWDKHWQAWDKIVSRYQNQLVPSMSQGSSPKLAILTSSQARNLQQCPKLGILTWDDVS